MKANSSLNHATHSCKHFFYINSFKTNYISRVCIIIIHILQLRKLRHR